MTMISPGSVPVTDITSQPSVSNTIDFPELSVGVALGHLSGLKIVSK